MDQEQTEATPLEDLESFLAYGPFEEVMHYVMELRGMVNAVEDNCECRCDEAIGRC